MKLNIFANFGGHGGYQILSENILHSLRNTLNTNSIDSINIFPIRTSEVKDPLLKRQLNFSKNLTNEFADVSLMITHPDRALHFHGKKRIIYPMHEGTKVKSSIVKRLNLMDQIWVSSSFNKKAFIESGVDESKIKLLLGGVNTDYFKPLIKSNKHLLTQRHLKLKPYTEKDPFTFLQVGKFETRKSSYETIHGFLDALENHPNKDSIQLKVKWSTTVASRSMDQIKSELLPLFIKYPLAAKCIKLVEGHNVDMVELYNNADCLIFPSKTEGIGLPLLEAMACGLPCITTEYGALADYLNEESCKVLPYHGLQGVSDAFYGLSEEQEGRWGIVKFKDISDAILDVLEMPCSKLYEMSQKSREHILNNFNHLHVGNRIIELLEDLN